MCLFLIEDVRFSIPLSPPPQAKKAKHPVDSCERLDFQTARLSRGAHHRLAADHHGDRPVRAVEIRERHQQVRRPGRNTALPQEEPFCS